MLEKISSFLDGLASLPYWQSAVVALLVVGLSVGAYFVLRPAPRPGGDFHAVEESEPVQNRELTVHVAGAVGHPGVVRLDEGDRVLDAIEEAGGPLPEADLESLNLAQTVQDGQKILVPSIGKTADGRAGFSGEAGATKVNINSASRRELEELPGIGPTLAERIVDYREKTGGFRSVDELKQVSGIGDKKFDELKDLVEV
jgi:competence protein ComEA